MPLYRIAAIVPAAFAIDQLNEYNKTNFALLQNGDAAERLINHRTSFIDDAQFNRPKHNLARLIQVHKTMASLLILEGGLKWQPFGF